MRKILAIALILSCSVNVGATTYFLNSAGGGGNDANSGLDAGHPWLSPNHAVNCGDVILAAASTSYSSANFQGVKWGAVSNCGTGSAASVAWVKCATFDACKITSSTQHALVVGASNWGVQGFENSTNTGNNYGCFVIQSSVHHIIFANDIANGCTGGGFTSFNIGSNSADYIVYVGDIAYNAASGSGACFEGFVVYQPKASDSLAGTHLYMAGNFAYANVDSASCNSGTPTDGEGFTFDTLDSSQSGPGVYTQQAVVYNNIAVGNGGRGYQTTNNTAGTSHAPIYVEFNTLWGNETDTHQNPGGNTGELRIVFGYNNTFSNNLVMTTAANAYGFPLFASYVAGQNGTDTVAGNWLYSAAGNNCGFQAPANGFACGTNTTGTNPNFNSPSVPGAPNCGTFTSVPNCMATVISNFTPTSGGATAFGYQPVSNISRTDPLFPAWLCNVNLPVGLVTPGCGPSGSGAAGIVIQ